jgi:hypothetical protein
VKADELDHIRADVQTAILEAQATDPTVTLEILWRLFDHIGRCATDYSSPDDFCVPVITVRTWASDVLEDIQLRAVGKVSYSETRNDFGPDTPEDHR